MNVSNVPLQSAVRNNISSEADRIVVNYYTDPLCCWSWAFKDSWSRLLAEFDPFLEVNYIMCGMISSWDKFEDPMNSVSSAAQMGPLWMHVSRETNVPIASEVWHTDPPASSIPACLAVKCACLQSNKAGTEMFHKLQHAIMSGGRNISREAEIMTIAHELSLEMPTLFNYQVFEEHWKKGSAKSSLRGDIQQALYYKIARYPTLTLTHPRKEGIMMVGYRPYEVLKTGFTTMFS